jgi:hypothetical protein
MYNIFKLQYTDKNFIGHQFFTMAKNSNDAKIIFGKYLGVNTKISKTTQL